MEQSAYLLETPVKKLFFKFAVPSVISMVIACLYNIVDQIFVGQGVGVNGNAATGIVFPITVIALAVAMMFGDGIAAFLAISHGRGDHKNSNRAVATGLTCALILSVVLVIVCYSLGDMIYYALGATENTIALARVYGQIIIAALPIFVLGQSLSSVIRADGNPKYAMICVLSGAVLNCILDPIAIFALGWGIEGAAIATIIGQLVTFALAFVYLFRTKTFRITRKDWKPNGKVLRTVSALGMGSFLTQISIVVVTIVNNILIVSYGAKSIYGAEIPLGTFVVIMKLFQIVLCFAMGISFGVMPVIGYNYGAKRYDRVRQVFKYVLVSTLILGVVSTIIFMGIPHVCVSIFGGAGDTLYMEFAVKCLRIYLMLVLFVCLQKACAIFLQSIGKTKFAIPLSLFREIICLTVFAVILPIALGIDGIFWAAPLADALSLLVTGVVTFFALRRLPKTAQ